MPAKPTRPTEDIIRRFAAGESLEAKQIAADYDCSTALLGATLKKLKGQGVTFTEDTFPGPTGVQTKRWTQATPTPTGGHVNWGPAPGVKKLTGRGPGPRAAAIRAKEAARKREERAAKRAAQPASALELTAKQVVKMAHRNGSTLAHPVPALGDKVEVYLLMLDDNGRVNVGLRSPESAWLVGVDGFSARDH